MKTPIREVVQDLARRADIEVEFAQEVEPSLDMKVNLIMKGTTIEHALRNALQFGNLEMEEAPKGIRIIAAAKRSNMGVSHTENNE